MTDHPTANPGIGSAVVVPVTPDGTPYAVVVETWTERDGTYPHTSQQLPPGTVAVHVVFVHPDDAADFGIRNDLGAILAARDQQASTRTPDIQRMADVFTRKHEWLTRHAPTPRVATIEDLHDLITNVLTDAQLVADGLPLDAFDPTIPSPTLDPDDDPRFTRNPE